MLTKFRDEREAPLQLFDQLGTAGESFLVTVSDRAALRTPLTTDLEQITNSLLFTQPNGSTALLDGVHLALTELKKSRLSRKALVVVSDGGDNNSLYSMREMEKIVMEADAQIFTILLCTNPATPEEVRGPDLMRRLALQSGGTNFVIRRMEDIHDAMSKIGVILHNQYLLGYYVPDEAQSGQYRRIAVQLLLPSKVTGLAIHARQGYYAP